MGDAFQTHGAISWLELRTKDVAKAKAFYTDVIGWETEEMPTPDGSYTVLKADGAPIGGITTHGAGDEGVWAGYITVDNVDQRVAKAEAAGGSVVMAPMDIPGVGRTAVIIDAVGAPINFITYEKKD
ncbi:MAG: VOC family protein [Alphaproteobacteria bacterium]